jgi:DNA-binding SARP family transcriptional activator
VTLLWFDALGLAGPALSDCGGPELIEFRLLGPVEVWAGGRRVEVGQPRQRAVLAVLAADAGRTVTAEVLIDRVWDDTPPPGARRSLQAHITRIRRVLDQAGVSENESAPLVHRGGGYLLDGDPERVDLHRVRGLLDASRDPACTPQRRAELLRLAVPLWRGEPLTGITGQWAERMRRNWQQLRSDVILAWAQAELTVGNAEAVVSRLAELDGENTLSEALTAALMRALRAAGRPAEALEQYATIRQRLVEELGVDPSPELKAVHESILRGDLNPPAPAEAVMVPVTPPAAGPVAEAVAGPAAAAVRPPELQVPVPADWSRRRRVPALVLLVVVFLTGLTAGVLGMRWWPGWQPLAVATTTTPEASAQPPDVCVAPGTARPTGEDVLDLPDTAQATGSWWINRLDVALLDTDGRRFAVGVTKGTMRPGDILVVKSNVKLVQGRSYALAFTASSDRATTVRVRAQDSEPPMFHPSYDRELSVSRSACEHRYRFTAAKTSTHSELTFQVGGHAEDFELKVADVLLVEEPA